MAEMFNPPHPGLTLRDDVLPELGLSVTQAAEQLGVSRVALSRVLNGRAAVSPEMALRVEAWLGAERGGRASVWLSMQSAYDLWQARQAVKTAPLKVRPAVAARVNREAPARPIRGNKAGLHGVAAPCSP